MNNILIEIETTEANADAAIAFARMVAELAAQFIPAQVSVSDGYGTVTDFGNE